MTKLHEAVTNEEPRYDETSIETDPVRIFWLDEMVSGYMDGRNLDNPEPSANRNASYKHGFANGRDDRAGCPRASASALRILCEKAIADDIAAHSPVMVSEHR